MPAPSALDTRLKHTTSTTHGPVTSGSTWMVLERLLLTLEQQQQAAEHIRLTLDAVRHSIWADAVFWYPLGGEAPIVVGDGRLSPDACRRFAQSLLDGTRGDEEHLLWSRRDDGPSAVAFGLPRSAVLVRVGQSRPAWLVAVSLEPKHHFRPCDLDLLSLARRLLLNQGRHNHLRACMKDSLVGLVRALTATLDAKDPCTSGHSERVARIGVLLARRLGLSDRQVSDVFVAGLLHDVGKIGVADEVLRKPGRLTGEELAAVREHVIIGDRILGAMPQLGHLRPGVRHHHERYDGRGYPDGLAGHDIPQLARLLAVADSCDAMLSSRRYRQALPPSEIDAILRQGAGTQWDPEIIDLFMACRPQIYPTIYRKGPGDLACRAVDQMVESAAEEASLLLAIG